MRATLENVPHFPNFAHTPNKWNNLWGKKWKKKGQKNKWHPARVYQKNKGGILSYIHHIFESITRFHVQCIMITIVIGTFHSSFWLNYHLWDDSRGEWRSSRFTFSSKKNNTPEKSAWEKKKEMEWKKVKCGFNLTFSLIRIFFFSFFKTMMTAELLLFC